MIVSADQLVHLTGYAAIAAVLASASWAGTVGAFVGYAFALGVGILLIGARAESTRQRIREQAERDIERRRAEADGGAEQGDA